MPRRLRRRQEADRDHLPRLCCPRHRPRALIVITPPSTSSFQTASRRILGNFDVEQVDVARLIGRFEAVDERAALDGDAAACRVDARMRRRQSGRHGQLQLNEVARVPLPLDGQIALRIDAAAIFLSLRTSTGLAHQAGMRNDSLHGAAGVFSTDSSIVPCHG